MDAYNQVGSMVDQIVSFYKNIKYETAADKDKLPDFLKAAIGPPLELLPSFIKTSRLDSLPAVGLGKALDITHQETRDLGLRLAIFVFGKQRTRLLTEDGKLRKNLHEMAPLPGDIVVESGLIIDSDLAKEVVMLGAISQRFLMRLNNESDLLDNEIGNAIDVYNKMHNIRHKLRNASINQDITFPDNLDIDFGAISKVFKDEKKTFLPARVFAYAANYGIMSDITRGIFSLPKHGVNIENPADAAAAVFAMAYFRQKLRGSATNPFDDPNLCIDQKAIALSQKIAMAENDQAAQQILRSNECEEFIKNLKQYATASRKNVTDELSKALEIYITKTPSAGLTGGDSGTDWRNRNKLEQRVGHNSEVGM